MPETVAIVGSRKYPDLERVRAYVRSLPAGTVVVSGHAPGVDRAAEEAAKARGLSVISLPAEWKQHGKLAGFLRNTKIVQTADRVVAFWDGSSRGTKDTIAKAKYLGKSVEIIGA